MIPPSRTAVSRCPIDFFGDNYRQLDLIRVNSENIPVNIYALMESSDSGRLREIAGLFDADSRLMRNWIGLGGAELNLTMVIPARPEGR